MRPATRYGSSVVDNSNICRKGSPGQCASHPLSLNECEQLLCGDSGSTACLWTSNGRLLMIDFLVSAHLAHSLLWMRVVEYVYCEFVFLRSEIAHWAHPKSTTDLRIRLLGTGTLIDHPSHPFRLRMEEILLLAHADHSPRRGLIPDLRFPFMRSRCFRAHSPHSPCVTLNEASLSIRLQSLAGNVATTFPSIPVKMKFPLRNDTATHRSLLRRM